MDQAASLEIAVSAARSHHARRKFGVELVQTLVLVAALFCSVRILFQNFRVEGPSMQPTLASGELLWVNKAAYYRWNGQYVLGGPQRGDIAVLHSPDPSDDVDLIKRIIGLPGDRIRVERGQVLVDDQPLGQGVPDGFGLVLQGYGLVSVLTAAENVEVALQGLGLSRDEVRDRAAAALAEVGLEPVGDHLVEQLSGGQQQRVAVARALAMDPAVLLADELTAELDAHSRTRVLALVLGAARRGTLVVLATHDPEVADACAARLRLVDGRVAEDA